MQEKKNKQTNMNIPFLKMEIESAAAADFLIVFGVKFLVDKTLTKKHYNQKIK